MTQVLQVDPIHIFYPNGGTSAAQMYVWDGSKPILWDGEVTFSGSISIGAVTGNATSNAAAPVANEQLGVLPAIATTAAPSYTNGRLVQLSTDLSGALRVSATIDTSAISTSANQTNGSQKTQIVDGSGNVIGSTGNALQVNLKTSSITLPVSLTSTTITGTVTAIGNKTNNAAAAGATNLGALTAIANASAPSWTEGNLVALSTDLAGNLRVAATIDTSAIATSANQTNGNQLVKGTGTAGSASTGVLTVQGIASMTPVITTTTVSATAVSAAVTSVNDSATNQTLLSSNAARKGYKLYNASTVTAFVKEGTTATTSDYSYQLVSGGYYESIGVGVYTGRIDCIWASDASGAMKVTELS